ncbi:GntR family transcriptional regulator [Thermoanaerobacterium thermosaccharolyticum]|uniref:GntR family transcriptional regulator n=1 Tax=Thermoanaerobacterium thermosaccharolyticum TaxID=1517 RepID=UPI003D296DDF
MFLKIEFESEIPIYVQIRNQIVEGIALGKIKEGDSLPSIRQLAGDFGINLHTVKKAFDILKDEGYLIVYRRKGYVVCKNAVVDEKFIENYKNQISPILADAYCRGMTHEEIMKICGEILRQFKG